MAGATRPPGPEVPAGAQARLAARRAALLQRSAELRERLALHAAALEPALAAADSVREGWRWLRAHPWVPLAAAGVLLLRRPRRLFGLVLLAWRGWRLWRRVPPRWRGWLADRMSVGSTLR
ncbi:YqjK-like protein [Tepidimonas sediminis]|uniref:YqjK-like protein n=1 Tax=Tepidimonas sediminis TaxID=2588941 RepID=A0A554WTF7_9BURK|nr:YqjK family protein [Tepidimonas sediminis]TSE26871.1 YqjK-like protein [Tepidimonas sediminis]